MKSWGFPINVTFISLPLLWEEVKNTKLHLIEDDDSEFEWPENRLEYRFSEVEPMPEMWFCLNSDGELYILGDHGDFEAAEDTAKSMGLDPIWTFGEASARQWRRVLNSQESRLGGEE